MKKSITKHFIFLFTLIFASCSNLFTSQESLPSNTKIHFTGTLCITGALPASLNETCHAELDSASLSRSALPSITIGSDYYYYFTAKQTSGGNSIISDNSIDNPSAFPSTGTGSVCFALELTTGKWDIECGIKKAENDVPVMSDTYPAPLTSANPVLNHTFYPKPSQSGSGSLELTFTYDNGTVDSVIVKCGSDEWTRSSSSATQWTVSEDSIDSGTYDVNIYFYKNDESENPILVYSTTQTINIFDNMLTNTWVSDGSNVIDSDGNFKLSSALITEYARTTFYVGDTGVGKEPSDTEGTGSPYTPLKTISKALEIIKANGDSSKDYRIFVSGTVPGAKTVLAPAKSLTIQGLNGPDENGNPKDTIDGSLEGSPDTDNTLYLSTQYPVFIKNLTITGNSEKNGIYYQTYSNDKKTLTLESGTYITGNKNGATIQNAKVVIKSGALISQNKRGVYASTGGELVIKEGAVITLNKGEANGAGIFVESGSSLEVQGGEISYNEASGNGGGINSSYCSFTMTGGLVKGNKASYGGGIYTNKTGNSISGGTITENEATVEGGGIYADYNLLLTGVEISLNKSALAGAVAAYRNALTLGENVYIPWGAKNENGTLVKAAGMNDLGIVDGGGVPSEYIIIGANLSKHSKEDPIALTSYKWTRGKTVVRADTNVTDLTTYTDFFTFTQDGWESKVSTDKKSIYIDMPIYVAGQTNHPYCGVAGNDTNGDGTKAKPFATISTALSLMNNMAVDYTVAIDGEVSGAQTIPSTLKKDGNGTYKARSVVICGATGNTTDILNGGFTQTSNGTTLKILTDVPVTIKNLKITGGYAASSSAGGGGIYANGDVTLSEGALVSGNYTASCGGGIYNDSKNLTIESGAEISGNYENGVSNCGGGGIFNYRGTLVISGGVIKTNSADHDGGAIYTEEGTCYIYGNALIGKDATAAPSEWYYGSNKAGNGGAICVNGGIVYIGYKNNNGTASKDDEASVKIMGNTVKTSSSKGGGIYVAAGTVQIAKTCVAYNYSPKDGGGIYTTGTVRLLEDAVIKGNKAYSYGGGVHVNKKGSLSMTSNSIIGGSESGEANTAASGGGVYVASNGTVTGEEATVTFGVSGASVSPSITGNSATNGGGGVYVENFAATFNMNSGSISNNKIVGGTTGGGGVEISYGTFNMNGGTISGNYIENPGTSTLGGAVDINTNGTFNIKGTVSIPYGGEKYKNDVSSRGNPIKIAGEITLPEGVTSVATIIPRSYSEGTQVLAADDDDTLADAAGKFTVTPEEAHPEKPWRVNYQGELTDGYDATEITLENYESVTKMSVTSAEGMKVISSLSDSTNKKTFDGKTITLKEDISLGSDFTPIGSGSSGFKGTFDGNDKTITISNTVVFDKLAQNSLVKNLNLAGNTTKGYALASGDVSGTVEYCTSTVRITNCASAGGFVYRVVTNGKVQYCINKGTIDLTAKASGNAAGGIAYSVYGGTVDRCINEANISGKNIYLGGIAGTIAWHGTISNCKNTGNVTTSQSLSGGIVALMNSDGAGIKNCSSSGTISSSSTSSTQILYIVGKVSTGLCPVENTCDQTYYHSSNSTKTGYSSNIDDTLETLNSWASANNGVSWKKTGSILELDLSW